MERDPYESGTDVGRDIVRDLSDEPPAAIRDAAPDILSPIDETSPVSGHTPPPEPAGSPIDSPEHDWNLAKGLVRPAFRPVGTTGLAIETVDPENLAQHSMQSHSQPLLDEGPAGIPVVYTMAGSGFDILINGDHLLSWGIQPADLQNAAVANLRAWAASAPWTEEVDGDRRLISSDTGDGLDSARIILPETLEYLARELGPSGRVLVGIPERHLLAAAALRPEDAGFAALFSEFVIEQSGEADEPVDRRLFEIVDGQLVEFS